MDVKETKKERIVTNKFNVTTVTLLFTMLLHKKDFTSNTSNDYLIKFRYLVIYLIFESYKNSLRKL